MKKSVLIFSLILITFNFSFAQQSNEKSASDKIGITFSSFGENDVIQSCCLDGAASYHGVSFYTIGFNYIHQLNHRFDIETGLEYSNHTLSINPSVNPNTNMSSYNTDFSLINIPISLRYNLLKYFFINGGMLLEIDADASNPIKSQAGIGGLLGIAAEYDFNCGASVFINPYIKAHALVPFSIEDYNERLMESGIRIGVTYQLK